MTDDEIKKLMFRVTELKIIEYKADELLRYVSKESSKNHETCDHTYPDGSSASRDGLCTICKCCRLQ